MPQRIFNFFSKNYLLKQSSTIFLASFFGSIALFASSIILAGVFGPVDFANFKIATNLFIFLPSLIEFGIGVTLVKYIAEFSVSQKNKIPHLIVYFLKIRAVSFAVLIVLLFLFKNQISEIFFHSPAFGPLVIAGLWISGFIFFEVFKQIALGFQEFKRFAVSQFLVLFLSGVLSLAFGYFFGVFWALVGWGIAYFLGNLPVFFFAINKISSVPAKEFNTKEILFSFSLPMYSLIIPNLLGTALVPLVSLFFPKETVGLFAFGMVFYNGAVLIPNAFNSVLLPRLSEAIEKKQDLWKILGKTALQYTAIAVPAILLVFVLTQPILQIIAPAYSKGANITLALIIASILLGYLSLLGSYYTAQERVKANWIVTIARNLLLLAVSLMALFYF